MSDRSFVPKHYSAVVSITVRQSSETPDEAEKQWAESSITANHSI